MGATHVCLTTWTGMRNRRNMRIFALGGSFSVPGVSLVGHAPTTLTRDALMLRCVVTHREGGSSLGPILDHSRDHARTHVPWPGLETVLLVSVFSRGVTALESGEVSNYIC